jgi:hypothetical protein
MVRRLDGWLEYSFGSYQVNGTKEGIFGMLRLFSRMEVVPDAEGNRAEEIDYMSSNSQNQTN